MPIKQFVDQFHSLSGKTIGEKLKNLNQLITDVKSGCLQHEIDQFIAEVNPKNNFEKLLKGRLIDSFKKSQVLLDVLRCDDKLFIKQVLGCDWFFEGCSADFPTCEFFITDVFPNTSFTTRNDIIHLLSVHLRDDHVAEQLFRAVRKEYGIQQARPLLCVCSTQFIQSVLDTDDRICFTRTEVCRLVKKHPHLVKANINNKCFSGYISKIMELMLDVNIKIFIELFETKSLVHPKIGRRGSKKLIRNNTAAVIKLATKYIKVLKLKYLQKYLKPEDFTQFYMALFPVSYKHSHFFVDNGDFYRIVEVLAPNKHLEMLLTCFETVYGEKLLTQTNLIGKKLLLMLPPDKREMCAQQKIDKCINQDEDETYWICYLSVEKSVPMLRKFLMEAPDLDSRSRFISYLILTCKINEDLEALASVCKYVISRYRNDNFSLRANILYGLRENFDLLKLDDRHWTSVLEVIKIFFLNEEHQKNSSLVSNFLVRSIQYKLKNCADISEQIDQLIIMKTSTYYCHSDWVVMQEEPKYQQVIFEAFGERIPCLKKIKFSLTEVAFSLLNSVCHWNRNNPLFQSSLCKFPWVVESLRAILDTDLDSKKSAVLEFLQYDLETKQLVCPEHVYEEEVEVVEETRRDVEYYLKMDTEKFVQNAEEELKFLLNNNTKTYKHLFRAWNLRSFTQIKEVVVQICSRLVENDKETCTQSNAIFVLSFLMEAESFACLIKPFYPVTDKIDPADKNTERMLPLIRTSAMCMKHVNPWNEFSSIIQFCKGDYLKYVLGSLMSVCYNTKQKKIVPFLQGLSNSPVSVKKHAVRLSFNIVCMPQLLPLLNELWCADKNPATREILLALVWRAFLAEPTPDMFALLKYCLKSLRVDDKNMHDKLSNDAHIPYNYKAEYLELCWDKLHELLQQGARTKSLISNLVYSIAHLVDLLPSSFCYRVIKQYLCEGSPYKETLISFSATLLLKCHTQNVLNERFNIISDLLKDLVGCSASGRKDIEVFIKDVCVKLLDCKCTMVHEVLQKLFTFWPSVLKPVNKFKTFMFLKFTSLYISCTPEVNLVSYGKIISDYVTSVLEEYGPETIILVSTSFAHFVSTIKMFRCEETCTINIITGLLTEPVSRHAYIMAAHLIPIYNIGIGSQYVHIIQSILRAEDKAIRVVTNSLPVFDSYLNDVDNEL